VIEESLQLKWDNLATIKSSAPAQKSVAYQEQSLKRQATIDRVTGAIIPPPLDDLSIARNPKREPNERFAAIDRFARVFLKIRVNVLVALFDYLNGGPESEVVKALARKVVTFKRDSKTGALVEVDGRGRKRSPATRERIRLAAQRISEGYTQRKMAPELFPNLTKDQA
jgi:hypothetical protein